MGDKIKEKIEELKKEYLKKTEQNKFGHDMAVLMGSHGISPKHMQMFEDSMSKINNHNSRNEVKEDAKKLLSEDRFRKE